MFGPRRPACALVAVTFMLVASAPCLCGARPASQPVSRHACCPPSGNRNHLPGPDVPRGGRHAGCPHCAIGEVPTGNAAVSAAGSAVASPLLALAQLSPVLVLADAVDRPRHPPPAPVASARLFVVFRSLLL